MKDRKISIDANLCYHFSFSIFDEETGLRTDDEGELRAAIRSAYPDAIFDDDPAAEGEPFFREVKIAQDFLHGGGLPFDCFRVLLKSEPLQFNGFQITGSTVYMTVFPQSDTVQTCICFNVRDASPDEFVYLRHVQGNGAKLRCDKTTQVRELSVQEIFRETADCLQRRITDVQETYLLEIKDFRVDDAPQEDLTTLLAAYPTMIYGILCGDEGWRNVPVALAQTRLNNQWGSRDFMRFVAFGNNYILFNLSQGTAAQDYRENRRRFDQQFYGEMHPYFAMDSDVAGVNHGILFAMETVLVIKTICNRILRRQASYYIGGQGSKIGGEIRKLKAYRGELITTLNKVENLSISEIGELERVVLISQDIEPIIDKIKYLLELLESELDLLYQTSNNRFIGVLTVAGVVLAMVQVLQNAF